MSILTGCTQKTIKYSLFALGLVSLVGMVGASQASRKLIAVPSVEDNYLNSPVTAYYNNPNQGFFKALSLSLMAISSASFSGACWLTWKNQNGVEVEDQIQIPDFEVNESSTPQNLDVASPSLSSQIQNNDDIWADPWNDEIENQAFETTEIVGDRDWTFQAQESNLDHPALSHKNWPDELAILIYGEQGSGKTSKLLWLAEQHLERGNIVLIVSDFAYPGWIKGIEVAGINGDFNAISEALNAICNEGEARKNTRGVYGDKGYFAHDLPTVVLIADEVTSWSEQEVLEMPLRRLARLILQDLRQANLKVYIGGHGRTLKTLFGKALEGKKETFDSQFVQVQCKAKTDLTIENGKKCAGQVWVNYFQGNNQASTPVKIPPLLPTKECSKTVKYTTPKGEKSTKIVYDFSKYKAISFSQYHAEENERRQELKNLA